MRVAHVVSDDVTAEHLRVLGVLARAGGAESVVVVDHGSRLRGPLAQDGLLTRGAALSVRTRRKLAFRALTEQLWERDLDAVHIHGHAAAPLALAAARWLDLPVVFTPGAATPAPPRRTWRQSLASLFGRDVDRQADGIMLIHRQDAAGEALRPGDRPLLRVAASADPALVVSRYRELLASIDARIGRESAAAPDTHRTQVA